MDEIGESDVEWRKRGREDLMYGGERKVLI